MLFGADIIPQPKEFQEPQFVEILFLQKDNPQKFLALPQIYVK